MVKIGSALLVDRTTGLREDWLRGLAAELSETGPAIALEAPKPVLVEIRRAALRRALRNLMENAQRYATGALVTVRHAEAGVEILIDDDGPGIPPERREEALKPFTRLDPARNQNRGQGVGLGLSIAADIARAHGGQLRLGQGERLGGLRAEIVIPR